MHQCLNCSKPCGATTIFCDECRTSLLKRQQPSGAEQAKIYEQPVVPHIGQNVDISREKLATPPSTRSFKSPYKTRSRTLLPVFIILGAISLVTGGILLAETILQHHTLPLLDMASIPGTSVVLSPQIVSTTWPGKTQTSAISPVAGTPITTVATPGMKTGTGTVTGITSTTTPAPGAATPTPTSITTTPTTPATCALQAAPTHLSFTATLLQPDPPGQSITLKTTGACGKPVMWTATADASWIQLSSSTGSDNGSGSALTVSIHSNQIVGVYNAHITCTAVDSNGITLQNSPQTISLTLTVIG